ncbi:hypothetical protein RND71_011543 [Anisodus tanguticus]|uniref:Uncharacterized protein n=1 Tax=Anisodus tanguticus TaxID=243964 RepID=A0AAE1VKZ9_9SOLA|nr:hypothetical protein RND71_011543 [Anisodus tanguticus]
MEKLQYHLWVECLSLTKPLSKEDLEGYPGLVEEEYADRHDPSKPTVESPLQIFGGKKKQMLVNGIIIYVTIVSLDRCAKQSMTEKITGLLPDPPGVKLQKEGLKAKHPVVFIPELSRVDLLWEGHQRAGSGLIPLSLNQVYFSLGRVWRGKNG